MNQIKKELLYTLIIKIPDQTDLKVTVNPEITVGLDPRNDLVLISDSMSFTQLSFKIQNDDLIVTQLGIDGTTLLFENHLLKNHSYLLLPGDILKIDAIEIKISKQLGVRLKKSNQNLSDLLIERPYVNRSHIHENQNGINLNFSDNKSFEDEIKKLPEDILIKKIKPSIHFKLPTDIRFVPYFFICLIFDYLLSYFLLTLLPQIPLRITTFFIFQELIFLVLFKNLISLNLIHDNFFRRFGIWFSILFFLFFPMTLSNFNKVVRPVHIYKSNMIDIHGVFYQSHAPLNSLSINASLPPELHIITNIKQKHFTINFYHDLISESVELRLDNILTLDQIKNSLGLIRDFNTNDSINKNLMNEYLFINRSSLIDFILTHGPFLNSINTIKNQFFYGLDSKIESIDLNQNSPLAIYRDQVHARVVIWSKNQVYLFTFTRPKSLQLENMIIEKVLANISTNLINKEVNEIGFFEMFDSLPEYNWRLFLKLYQQEIKKVKGSTNLGLINFYNNQLDQLHDQFPDESRNANSELINQLEFLKNYLNQP